jgi:hypothetical protein
MTVCEIEKSANVEAVLGTTQYACLDWESRVRDSDRTPSIPHRCAHPSKLPD